MTIESCGYAAEPFDADPVYGFVYGHRRTQVSHRCNRVFDLLELDVWFFGRVRTGFAYGSCRKEE